jgi:hypothetical protein
MIDRANHIGQCLTDKQPIEPLQARNETDRGRKKTNEEYIEYFRQFDCEKGDLQALLKFLAEDSLISDHVIDIEE